MESELSTDKRNDINFPTDAVLQIDHDVKWFSWTLEALMTLQTDHVNVLFKSKHENNDQSRQQCNTLCVIDVFCLYCFILTAKCLTGSGYL